MEHGAINLSQGFPDFDPPVELTRALAETTGSGPHQYAITWGHPEFGDNQRPRPAPGYFTRRRGWSP
ncbi:MAG: hypothetical protein LBT13_03985 [Treponema sp.]|jgi:aspartate/methionine/tyrosine aminotransferase|nr:hypothetical protein [Treponema sp.]